MARCLSRAASRGPGGASWMPSGTPPGAEMVVGHLEHELHLVAPGFHLGQDQRPARALGGRVGAQGAAVGHQHAVGPQPVGHGNVVQAQGQPPGVRPESDPQAQGRLPGAPQLFPVHDQALPGSGHGEIARGLRGGAGGEVARLQQAVPVEFPLAVEVGRAARGGIVGPQVHEAALRARAGLGLARAARQGQQRGQGQGRRHRAQGYCGFLSGGLGHFRCSDPERGAAPLASVAHLYRDSVARATAGRAKSVRVGGFPDRQDQPGGIEAHGSATTQC